MDEFSADEDAQTGISIPEPTDWSAAAVRLMQGVVYHDNKDAWESILANVSPLIDFFGRLAIVLVIDESEGMAYLRQLDEDEMSPQHERIPRLFRRTKLSYEATLLCVLLRDELRRFEEEDVNNERCVVSETDLLEPWQAFFPSAEDEVRLAKQLHSTLKKIEALRFIRQFEKQPPTWEIKRILKARLPVEDLETLRRELLDAVEQQEKMADQDSAGLENSEA